MKKCDNCIVGSGKESYYDYGGESFVFETTIINNFCNSRNWEILSLFNFCPECGHKNNLKALQKFLADPIEDYLLSGRAL